MDDDSKNETISEPQRWAEVQIDYARRINFASAQNNVAVLNSLTITNTSGEPITNLKVTVSSHPSVFTETTWNIDRIASESDLCLQNLSTPLDIAMLSRQNEAEIGELTVTVENSAGEQIEERYRLELLARDEWGGINDMSQILAAFVSPNDPVVAALLKEASRLLERAGLDGSLDGYQSNDPGRVWLLAGAIWSATTGLGLSYAVPPASFEQQGQKIRGPGRIRSEGLATCLDTSLLLAAAFEAAGLNSAILFSDGHAWVGVWLTERDFGHVKEPDIIAVRKASQAKEFVPIETTLMTKRPTIGFEHAVDEGRRRLSEDRESEFLLAVDITRARAARIRPLAMYGEAVSNEVPQDEAAPAALPKPLDLGLLPGEVREDAPDTPLGRIERWQRKLLDLSLRNRLLNFKDTKQSLPFICPDVSTLEDHLADNKKFSTLALREDDPVGNRTLTSEERRKVEEEVSTNAFGKRQIAVPLTSREMNNRLLTLYRKAKSDMQEGGTNTLFLAVGFLRWKKTEGDTRSYRAPLLLIPVKLERRSAQSQFQILHHEDDVRINSTLLEFLKRDFDLRVPEFEGDLPRDESGIDVPLILEIMRQKVRDVAGFEVVEDLALSTFSFAKYLMWKDLVDRTDQLRENALVSHLVDNPSDSFEGSGDSYPPSELDVRLKPKDLMIPLPADSSQLSAIMAAADGQNFVLIGPPGTGKSQTIANIISQCLANGKTVLFVAEKAAALDVVHRRLAAHGLGNACLELHSNKTDRKSVLNQLGRSWDRNASATDAEWIEVSEKLRLRRDQLNDYVMALHKRGTQGFSVFQAIGRTANNEPDVHVEFASMDAHDTDSYKWLISLTEKLQLTHAVVAETPSLALVAASDWSFAWQDKLLKETEKLLTISAQLRESVYDVSDQLALIRDTTGSTERIDLLSAILPRIDQKALNFSKVPDLSISELAEHHARLSADLMSRNNAVSNMSASYDLNTIGRIPLDQLDADWRGAQVKFWPFSALSGRKVQKLLQTYVSSGSAAPVLDIKNLFDIRAAIEQITGNPLMGLTGDESNPDIGKLNEMLLQASAFRIAVKNLTPFVDAPEQFGSVKAELTMGVSNNLKAKLQTFEERKKLFGQALTSYKEVSGISEIEMSLAELEEELNTILQHTDQLSDWTRWVQARDTANKQGLSTIVEAIETGALTGSASDAFEKAYAAWWLPLAMDESDHLRRFAYWEHEDTVNAFRELEDAAAKLAPQEVMRRIAHRLPTRDGVPRKSELGTLRHQLGLQRPSMPIRSLLSQMPTTFGRLAPCVLMSPLSIAQYLPAGQATFDVVIFDEASQITTWDAIGAIARGKQAIIVGDPKQLPPTNFFGRADNGDDDVPEIERDMPSILDEVCAAGIPTRRLDWHYRSRDEALIAFSNHHYYGGGLVTFPAPSTSSEALRFHYVQGTYARGQGRTNAAEAKAIAAMIKTRLISWLELPEKDRQTLGVITFNSEQQTLILDLLDEVRRTDSRLEWYFSDEREEPLIVKNLENIQGDERDVMLFSITFGPDIAGKLTMNFGALNSEGGEKRLNVAVTRARRELHVFASIKPEQIDLGRTRALGVNHLKAFLDYAERGAVALPEQDLGSLGPAENVFEQAIADALSARGWEIRTQIGVSGFRVDLGVVHPDFAGAFLAGVECDGAQYHSSATARDRDKVRQAVLEGLGWTILRIWSTDWFRNSTTVIERIHGELEVLLRDDREQRISEAKSSYDVDTESPSEPKLLAPPKTHNISDEFSAEAIDVEPSTPELLEYKPTQSERDTVPKVEKTNALQNMPHSALLLTNPIAQIDPDRFYEIEYTSVLREMISSVIEENNPLPMALVAKNMAQAHGWLRTGHKIASRVEKLLGDAEVKDEFGVPFVWLHDSYIDRVVFRGLMRRSIRDVSRAEIAYVIDNHEDALEATEDRIMALSRLLGVARLSQDARDYLNTCWRWRNETEN